MRKTLFLLLLSIPVLIVQGLTFEPLEQVFYPGQTGGRIKTFRINNTQSEQIAVRISILERGLSESGKETRSDATGDFLIFPSTMSLASGASQAVRVQWLGEEDIDQELAYRIIAEQIPVSFSDEESPEGSNINMLFRYIGSIYISPKNGEADIVISEMNREFSGGELKGLLIRLENRGTAHAIIKTPEITLIHFDEQAESKESLVLGENDLPLFANLNLLAGTSLVALVSIPSHWNIGAIDATTNFKLYR